MTKTSNGMRQTLQTAPSPPPLRYQSPKDITDMKPIHLAVFVSGNGTNLENIIHHFASHPDIHINLVVSNNAKAYALKRAKNHDIPVIVISKSQLNDPHMMREVMAQYEINFIILAGFLLMIPDFLIQDFDHRMINLHPALLPKHGGKGMYGHHVHQAVKQAGDKETGMTVHWVSPVCDGGEIIAQYRTELTDTDTVEDIARKEQELEQRFFPQVIEQTLKQIF